METTRSLAILKPDCLEQGVEQHAMMYILDALFRVVAMKRGRVPEDVWRSFYAEHGDKPFFPDLVAFMASGPVVVLALERESPCAYADFRRLLGATDPRRANCGTLRSRWGDKSGTAVWRNIGHGSDSGESAAREIAFWFRPEELDNQQTLRPPSALDEPPMGGLRSMDLGDLRPVVQMLNCDFTNEQHAGEALAPVLLRRLGELRERRAVARTHEGHDQPCHYCGEKCSGAAGDPGRWPVGFPHPESPGVVKWHHMTCVLLRLQAFDRFRTSLKDALGKFASILSGEGRKLGVDPDRHEDPRQGISASFGAVYGSDRFGEPRRESNEVDDALDELRSR